jgi:hypothetical protein
MPNDPDQLPDIQTQKGRCPHCGHASNFVIREGPLPVKFDPEGQAGVVERVGVLHCPGCNKATVVIEEAVVERQSPEGPPVVAAWRGVHWWPVAGVAGLDPDVPEPVASAFAEGTRALSADCPRAAAVMFRAMLAAIVRDKGSQAAQQAGGLRKQLKKMGEEHTLPASLMDWAAEIRLVGDAGAHPEDLEPVTLAEARDLARLCRQMLSVVYELPARIHRARSIH